MSSSKPASAAFKLPLAYTTFFLIIEPFSTIVGAFYAHFLPLTYLQLTHLSSAPSILSTSHPSPSHASVPLGTSIVLSQLANLYFLFAINEALVLRCTSDLRVWRTVLFGLLVADLGHLYSVKDLGWGIYWEFWKWNAIDWGNVAFVYCGALMRCAFLSGIGLGSQKGQEAARRVEKRRELENKAK